MASWSDVEAAATELAVAVRGRFEAHGLGLVATLRRDGAPRISGVEPLFALGELWLGMMPGSRKAADLLRDTRLALHSATVDTQVTDGDARINGRVVPVDPDDDATFSAFLAEFEARTGYPPPPGPFHLFRVDVAELSLIRPGGDHLDITWWREGGRVEHVERR